MSERGKPATSSLRGFCLLLPEENLLCFVFFLFFPRYLLCLSSALSDRCEQLTECVSESWRWVWCHGWPTVLQHAEKPSNSHTYTNVFFPLEVVIHCFKAAVVILLSKRTSATDCVCQKLMEIKSDWLFLFLSTYPSRFYDENKSSRQFDIYSFLPPAIYKEV